MNPLETPERFYVEAAQGWLELGNVVEANEELRNIPPHLRGHPEVLEVRWQLCAAMKQWDAGVEIAAALIQQVPEHALGWLHRSYCLHELKRTVEARDNLLRVVEKFPRDPIMRYNLACYECQLGRLEQAKGWLRKAFETGDSEEIKRMALEDTDLEPLRKEIRAM